MQKDWNEFPVRIDHREPPEELLGRIMLRIANAHRRVIRTRIICFGMLSLVALCGLILAWQELYAELTPSSFPQVASLLFSDAGTIAVYWQDFVFALAESFPVVGVSMVLTSIFAFLFSLRFLVKALNMELFRRPNLISITSR